jgi:hypothetical protein
MAGRNKTSSLQRQMKSWCMFMLFAACLLVSPALVAEDDVGRAALPSYVEDDATSLDLAKKADKFASLLQMVGELPSAMARMLSGAESDSDSQVFSLLDQIGSQANAMFSHLFEGSGPLARLTQEWSAFLERFLPMRSEDGKKQVSCVASPC